MKSPNADRVGTTEKVESKAPARELEFGLHVTSGYEGHTSDHVGAVIENRSPKAPLSRYELLEQMPVSTDVCITFKQACGYVQRVISQIKAKYPERDYYVEATRWETSVWRIA